MQLLTYFVRHGEYDTRSATQRLTERGIAQAVRAGEQLQALLPEAPEIIASSEPRAQQTAKHIAQVLSVANVGISDLLAVAGQNAAVVDDLARFVQGVKQEADMADAHSHSPLVLVSHEPLITAIMHDGFPMEPRASFGHVQQADFDAWDSLVFNPNDPASKNVEDRLRSLVPRA